jgi:hypothetical protein
MESCLQYPGPRKSIVPVGHAPRAGYRITSVSQKGFAPGISPSEFVIGFSACTQPSFS